MHTHCSRRSLLCWTVIGPLLLGSGTALTAAEGGGNGSTDIALHTKPGARGKTQKAASAPAKGSTPRYASAETAAKAPVCFGEAPKIQSVKPDEGKPGDAVTLFGKGFGPAACLRSVSFGPGYPAAFTFVNDTQITAVVPKGRRKGMAMMTLTTASGQDSQGFLVK
ncbi:MAG: IPT/TIG domain-containing protein [Nitrospira sp.]|nr:IPT/TIG domain-containing protein [Nitrospira sp.]MCW5788739.1 IPT/TIG domain-containing protein [Nitrospira sp.]